MSHPLFRVMSPLGGEVGSVVPYRLIYRHVMSTFDIVPEDVKEDEILVLSKDVLVLFDGTLIAEKCHEHR